MELGVEIVSDLPLHEDEVPFRLRQHL